MNISYRLNSILGTFKGWHTNRKLIVIESDDWGSIRMPGKKTYQRLKLLNSKIENDPYSKFDCIESYNDLEYLFDILSKYTDFRGNYPVITANTIMANPDFEKIKKSNYEDYFYEPFTTTYKRIGNGEKTFDLWNEGIHKGFISPQLHGREHLNALNWLAELKANNQQLRNAFEENCFGVPYDPLLYNRRQNLMAALDHTGVKNETVFQVNYIKEAAAIFQNIFGLKAISFIAPAYTWHSEIELVLKEIGIHNMQGISLQYEPRLDQKNYLKKYHYTGEVNKTGIIYTVRNSFFEPSLDKSKDWNDSCLNRIKFAFINMRPAIISTHRINFIGSIIPSNRDQNLLKFDKLLKEILKKWPDVEFISSRQLIDNILKK